jgi:hypothetical protein
MWLVAANTDYFIRLINIFKQVVFHIIHLPSSFDPTEVPLSFPYPFKGLKMLTVFMDDKAGHQAQNVPRCTQENKQRESSSRYRKSRTRAVLHPRTDGQG